MHYGSFLQILEKGFMRTNMRQKFKSDTMFMIGAVFRSSIEEYLHSIPRSMFLFGVVMTWLGCSPLGEKYSVHQSGYNFIILSENFKKPISIMFSMKYTTV